jgi:hypothetical protein
VRLFFFILLVITSCTPDVNYTPIQSETTLHLDRYYRSASSLKVPMFDPSDFQHTKAIFVPISYYAPVIDNTQAQLRLLITTAYDPDYGVINPTTFNIIESDSLKIENGSLVLYSSEMSQVTSFPPEPGSSSYSVYTDLTVSMILYEDSSVQIVPNFIHSTDPWIEVSNKPIIGFYFLATDYLVN